MFHLIILSPSLFPFFFWNPSSYFLSSFYHPAIPSFFYIILSFLSSPVCWLLLVLHKIQWISDTYSRVSLFSFSTFYLLRYPFCSQILGRKFLLAISWIFCHLLIFFLCAAVHVSVPSVFPLISLFAQCFPFLFPCNLILFPCSLFSFWTLLCPFCVFSLHCPHCASLLPKSLCFCSPASLRRVTLTHSSKFAVIYNKTLQSEYKRWQGAEWGGRGWGGGKGLCLCVALVKETRGGKGGGGGEEEEVMLGGRVVNCSIFAGNLNAN